MPFHVFRLGSLAVHIGDHLRFGIICGLIWGSFAVGDHYFAALYREPGWCQEKGLWCCTLFFTSLFTFYDVVHFSRLCKSWSFFDWSFSWLQNPWSFPRSRFILLRFRELNKSKFPLIPLLFSNDFLSYIAFAFHLKKVSTQSFPWSLKVVGLVLEAMLQRNNHYLEICIRNNSTHDAFPCETWFQPLTRENTVQSRFNNVF